MTLQEQIDKLASDAARERDRAQRRQALTNARTGAILDLSVRIAERLDVGVEDILAAVDALKPGPDDTDETTEADK